MEINNLSQRKKQTLNSYFVSQYKSVDEIYAFCTSTISSQNLLNKFNAVGTIIINNPLEFRRRLKIEITRLFNKAKIKNNQLISENVIYRNFEDLPQTSYAIPQETLIIKPINFQEENEFRFLFAKKSDAFQIKDKNYQYLISETPNPPRENLKENKGILLQLGSLRDICDIVIYK